MRDLPSFNFIGSSRQGDRETKLTVRKFGGREVFQSTFVGGRNDKLSNKDNC